MAVPEIAATYTCEVGKLAAGSEPEVVSAEVGVGEEFCGPVAGAAVACGAPGPTTMRI